ncbi:asparaginase [Alkalitalea saponilacus]|uniref:asparaginase n=1 Tax=Alkalitalea saponilacus TaxID=889453 RepID=A0A1T5BXN6_9BACT|nr:asparaginase [Alkalitalea saponilacus]ASB49557.1 L-asparaginase 1 [Alkalitalea saponilacus]SKB51897.1 L-asparaginase [Alkalitalea saponilacus]
MRQKLLIIYTGGTIGMVKDTTTNYLVPFDFDNIYQRVPELNKFDFLVESTSFSPAVDSTMMRPEIWIQLASIIEEKYHEYEGFVVLHGTDTMAYTASALSFLLHNLNKPVILTGSQLPLGAIRTDGKENLLTAIEIASAQKNGRAMVPEVAIYFQDKLFRGNRTTKYNAEHFHPFRSDNYPALAEVGVHIKYNYPYIRYATEEGQFYASKKMNTSIALIKIFPGITPWVLNALLQAEGIKAVILETYGSGNAPTHKWFLDALENAVRKGLIILNVTQCLAGSVEMWRYETGMHLSGLGVISGHDMTTESAVTKMMYLLANSNSPEEVKKNLNKNLKGEITL